MLLLLAIVVLPVVPTPWIAAALASAVRPAAVLLLCIVARYALRARVPALLAAVLMLLA